MMEDWDVKDTIVHPDSVPLDDAQLVVDKLEENTASLSSSSRDFLSALTTSCLKRVNTHCDFLAVYVVSVSLHGKEVVQSL